MNNDKFWLDDISILYRKDRLTEFFPSNEMTTIEKMNALVRLSIYAGILLTLFTKNYLYLYIPVITFIITGLIYYFQKDNPIMKMTTIDINLGRKPKENKNLRKPTINNPFMNYNYITSNPNSGPAEKSYDNKKVQKEIKDYFNTNLYRDVSDLYGKNNSQRQYYTMPNTEVVNDQTKFAKWCYGTDATCKENTIKCAPYSNQLNNLNRNILET